MSHCRPGCIEVQGYQDPYQHTARLHKPTGWFVHESGYWGTVTKTPE
jgi:hypothetical protein